ncbi:defensin coprisin-like [Mercenaria mercenaria]|uniref:defensin coprisin-like n=1 Tax=Mercenaria mercenaria TaxID=6596 RepID=UPI00234F45AA|nr:defensin coprisin-like [Mercenaria mercenaria]
MKNITVLCLIICLCIATSFADKKLSRVKRVTCAAIVQRYIGSRACDIHCRFVMQGGGECYKGGCYCEGFIKRPP